MTQKLFIIFGLFLSVSLSSSAHEWAEYETIIPENTSTITLPLNLSGEYELQIIRGNYCFYGPVEL
jgi:hypothetical protein